MATIAQNVTLLDRVQSAFERLVNNWHEANERQNTYMKTYNELARLSLRELDDIGLARGDIERIARETAQQ